MAVLLRQLHALRHGGGDRDASQHQHLIGAEPKRAPDPEREPRQAVLARAEERVEVMVEERAVAERSLHERRHEGGVARLEGIRAKPRLEEPVGVGAPALRVVEDLEGQFARGCFPPARRRAARGAAHARSARSGRMDPGRSLAPFA